MSRSVPIRPIDRALIPIVTVVLIVLAAIPHILIFYTESIAWKGPLVRKTFGGTPEEARSYALYALNQGFYDLSPALQALTGIALTALGHVEFSAALTLARTGAMLAVAVALVPTSTLRHGAAAK